MITDIFFTLALLYIMWEVARKSTTFDKISDKLDKVRKSQEEILDRLDDVERKLPKPIRPDYSNGPID